MDRQPNTIELSRRTFLPQPVPRLLGPPGTVSYRRQKRHSGIRNAAAYCNLARVPMPLASTRTATINCTPRPQGRRCTLA